MPIWSGMSSMQQVSYQWSLGNALKTQSSRLRYLSQIFQMHSSRKSKLVCTSIVMVLLLLSASDSISNQANGSPTAPPTSAYAWSQLSPSTSPSARISPNMVFDAADGYTLLFGGIGSAGVLGDTWSFNGNSWNQLSPATSPPARAGAAMVYDAADGYVVLFGGGTLGSGGVQYGDTWTFHNGIWTKLSTPTAPPARIDASIAYDAKDGYVVLFGGVSGNSCSGGCTYYSDTWEFKGGVWTQLSPSSAPKARAGAGMSYDSNDGYVLLFGGTTQFCCSNAGLGDTWKFVGGSWTQLSPSSSPTERNTFSMVYDPTLGGVLAFGGWIPAGACGSDATDTWEFSGGSWTQLTLATSPSGRQGAGIAYSTLGKTDILFGGQVNVGASPNAGCGNPVNQGDTWVFSTLNREVMVSQPTWDGTGYPPQWNAITEITVFRLLVNPDGTFGGYDGSAVNPQSVCQAAHTNGVKCMVAFGGAGVPASTITSIISNSKTSAEFINNLLNQVQAIGADGVHVDWENTAPCDFSSTLYTAFMKSLSTTLWAKNPNYIIDLTYADWESCSINPVALSPYVTHILYMFDPSQNSSASLAAKIGGPSKLEVGYDVSPDSNYYSPTLLDLQADYQAGYGVFFWDANYMTPTIYSNIQKAGTTPPTIVLPSTIYPSTSAGPFVVSVHGTGFTANSQLNFGYAPISSSQNIMITTTTDSTGSWSGTFNAPWTPNSYQMQGTDASGRTITVTMIVSPSPPAAGSALP
jgi:hypothetical protein